MRHKTFLINPDIIKANGVNVHKCIQKPGEFVITFGGSYHAGFNMGLNCAEAVNFGTKNWINLGIKANICKCQSDSVKIGMSDFISNLYNKKILKKKEFEEYKNLIENIEVLKNDDVEKKNQENSEKKKLQRKKSKFFYNFR